MFRVTPAGCHGQAKLARVLTTVLVIAFAGPASAGIITPFTEDFDTGNAGWTDSGGAPLDWISTGGPDGAGDGFVRSFFNFGNAFEGDQIALFRGEGEAASGEAFTGDWLTAGVSEVSFQIRHNFVQPLAFFSRYTGPGGFPGTVGLSFVPVLPNTWTEITLQLDPGNPAIIPEGPPGTYEATFGNVGRVQVGLAVPAGLAGFPSDVTFDLDAVTLVPNPGVLAVLTFAGLFGGRRRRTL